MILSVDIDTSDTSDSLDWESMCLDELVNRLPVKTRSQEEEKAELSWLNASLLDYVVFNHFMDNEKICRAILNIALKTFKLKLGELNVVCERSIQGDSNIKDVVLDVVVEDDCHIFDFEMQGRIKLMPVERIRDYVNSLDKEQLKKGDAYTKLKKIFVIVISSQDPFGLGEPVYYVEKRAKSLKISKFKKDEFNIFDYVEKEFDLEYLKNNLPPIKNKILRTRKTKTNRKSVKYDDGIHLIFLNASAFDQIENDELRTFLAYIMGIHLTDCDFYHVINERFKRIKQVKELRLNYMTTYYRNYYTKLQNLQEGIEIGREEGIEIGIKKAILNMLENFTDEQISLAFNKDVQEIAQIRKQNSVK